jgi:hypothetical protein
MYSRALACTGGIFVPGEPKTKKSRRSVRLTTAALEALHAHLSRQLEDMYLNRRCIFLRKARASTKGNPCPLWLDFREAR